MDGKQLIVRLVFSLQIKIGFFSAIKICFDEIETDIFRSTHNFVPHLKYSKITRTHTRKRKENHTRKYNEICSPIVN